MYLSNDDNSVNDEKKILCVKKGEREHDAKKIHVT